MQHSARKAAALTWCEDVSNIAKRHQTYEFNVAINNGGKEERGVVKNAAFGVQNWVCVCVCVCVHTLIAAGCRKIEVE